MIHTGTSYKILSSLEELQGQTVKEVYTQEDNETKGLHGMTYIITDSSIVLLQGDFCHRYDSLSLEEELDFEAHTGLQPSQILEQYHD